MQRKVIYPLYFCFILFTSGFPQQDSCSHQMSLAKVYAPHDISLETWRTRSLVSGILLPAVGPITVGVFAATSKVALPSSDSIDQRGQCFSVAYSQQVKTERIKEVVKGGSLGTGLGLVLYFCVMVAVVSMSLNGSGGLSFTDH